MTIAILLLTLALQWPSQLCDHSHHKIKFPQTIVILAHVCLPSFADDVQWQHCSASSITFLWQLPSFFLLWHCNGHHHRVIIANTWWESDLKKFQNSPMITTTTRSPGARQCDMFCYWTINVFRLNPAAGDITWFPPKWMYQSQKKRIEWKSYFYHFSNV